MNASTTPTNTCQCAAPSGSPSPTAGCTCAPCTCAPCTCGGCGCSPCACQKRD